MSKWKMVPEELTPEQQDAVRDWSKRKYGQGIGSDAASGCHATILSAAPAFEPDDAMVERALETFCCVGPTDKHAMRAALKAAFEVKP